MTMRAVGGFATASRRPLAPLPASLSVAKPAASAAVTPFALEDRSEAELARDAVDALAAHQASVQAARARAAHTPSFVPGLAASGRDRGASPPPPLSSSSSATAASPRPNGVDADADADADNHLHGAEDGDYMSNQILELMAAAASAAASATGHAATAASTASAAAAAAVPGKGKRRGGVSATSVVCGVDEREALLEEAALLAPAKRVGYEARLRDEGLARPLDHSNLGYRMLHKLAAKSAPSSASSASGSVSAAALELAATVDPATVDDVPVLWGTLAEAESAAAHSGEAHAPFAAGLVRSFVKGLLPVQVDGDDDGDGNDSGVGVGGGGGGAGGVGVGVGGVGGVGNDGGGEPGGDGGSDVDAHGSSSSHSRGHRPYQGVGRSSVSSSSSSTTAFVSAGFYVPSVASTSMPSGGAAAVAAASFSAATAAAPGPALGTSAPTAASGSYGQLLGGDPLAIVLKSNRRGLGVDEERRRVAAETLAAARARVRDVLARRQQREQVQTQTFVESTRARAHQRQTVSHYRRCLVVVQQLDDVAEVTDTPLFDDDPQTLPLEHLETRLEALLSYLRDEYTYCFFCGTRFDDQQDLTRSCPGPTFEDHQ